MKKSTVKILDAAALVTAEEGFSKLTIDKVAVKVGLSKGGVLYHFNSKDQLIEAMVRRVADTWKEGAENAYNEAKEGRGRMARGLISCLSDANNWSHNLRGVSAVVFAGLAHNPDLIEPLRETYRYIFKKLEADGLPEGTAETVLSSLDGMWLWWTLGLKDLDQDFLNKIKSSLETMVNQSR